MVSFHTDGVLVNFFNLCANYNKLYELKKKKFGLGRASFFWAVKQPPKQPCMAGAQVCQESSSETSHRVVKALCFLFGDRRKKGRKQAWEILQLL